MGDFLSFQSSFLKKKNLKSSQKVNVRGDFTTISPSRKGNHVILVEHGYPWLFHGHVSLFHTHGQEYNHSTTETWLTIVIIMVITCFPMVNHSSLKKKRIEWQTIVGYSVKSYTGHGSNMTLRSSIPCLNTDTSFQWSWTT